jgi:hypothetical protein
MNNSDAAMERLTDLLAAEARLVRDSNAMS